ncbi:E3 ubiquitin-protein ligase SIAH1-like [Centruroides sculpturatus]|uniref:E3 ubiquitin-protein ligase SIAH1-like n=1 Tax=Centruroides sculpturatus TaxID=218467 RepID=UPI000C6EB70F|nr:E3 ubiquitin-protein ligase SIAH1-like [Centruroides sculpturatus]
MEDQPSSVTRLSESSSEATSHPPTDPAMIALFECPVCYSFMSPPVYQCRMGHVLCSYCKVRVSSCPTCRGEMGNYRNLMLEKMSELVALPCKYRDNGCSELKVLSEKKGHEKYCSFKTCQCPSLDPACQWEGTYLQAHPHLLERHPTMLSLDDHVIRLAVTGLDLSSSLVWTSRLKCYRRHFLIQIIKTTTENELFYLYIIVRILANRREAARFLGKIEVKGRGRSMSWSSVPRSITSEAQGITRNGDCLTLTSKVAERMLEQQALGVSVTIERREVYEDKTE